MAATVRVSYYGASGSEPAGVSAEGGITFSLSDAQAPAAGTAPVQIPTSTGTNYSWFLQIALEVTGSDSTTGTNYTVRRVGAPSGGVDMMFDPDVAYAQPTGGNKPTDVGTGPLTVPAGFTLMSTSAAQWDAGGDSFGTTGRKGDFARLIGAVSDGFAGGGGQETFPNLEIGYDEA